MDVAAEKDDTRSTSSKATSRASTTASTRLREARIKEELARKRQEQLLKQQELRKKEFELKEEMDKMKAENELENARAEAALWQEAENEQYVLEGNRNLPLSGMPEPDIDNRTQAWCNQQAQTPEGGKENVLNVNANDFIPNTDKVVAGAQKEQAGHDGDKKGQANKVSDLGIANMLAMAMSLPKPDIQPFSGNPVDYWKFMNTFEVNIGDKVNDDRMRLNYLIQFCTGKARDAIENCILLEPSAGYARAKLILHDQFGRNYIVARAHVERVLKRSHIRSSDSQALWDLARDMRRCQITTSQLGYTADMSTTETLLKIQELLPIHLQGQWASKAHSLMEQAVIPNFSHMTDFVEQAAKVASNVFGKHIGRGQPGKQQPAKSSTKPRSGAVFSTAKEAQTAKCPCCSMTGHGLGNCDDFKRKSSKERHALVKQKKLCFNCLKPSHAARECKNKGVCRKEGCGKKHHTLIHLDLQPKEDKDPEQGELTPRAGKSNEGSSHAVGGRRAVSLRVVPVRVVNGDKGVSTWALLDNGSDVSLCEHGLIHELGVVGRNTSFKLTTVNTASSQKGMEVSLSIQSLNGDVELEIPSLWTVDRLPTSRQSIPVQEDVDKWPHLQGIELPNVAESDIRLLIGSDVPEAFWVEEERRGRRKEPYAIRSPLGWTVMGPTSSRFTPRNGSVNNMTVDSHLQFQLERFWQMDKMPGDEADLPAESTEDRRAKMMMEDSVTLTDGHYQLGLPWRRQPPNLPNNKWLAESRLKSLKRRLQRDENLHMKYSKTMKEYLSKGHAQEVTNNSEQNFPLWYLPHHPVTHPMKPEKVRVVFDCAAKFQGISLNNQLLSGSDLTNKLIGVLMRFRQEKIALVADIEGMFHQVKVTPSDVDALRFLWWPDGDLSKEPKEYQMLVHLFGATSSPSCATFALRRTVEDNKDDFNPDACQTVRDNFYVDDCLKSVASKEDGRRLVSQLRELLQRGGFRLTKWVSNDIDVLSDLPQSERAASIVDLDLGNDHMPTERTLGVLWDMETDAFQFRVSTKDVPHTRRGILSATSSLYDPLGFVAPFTVNAKILLQDLCARGLGWDEQVADEQSKEWDSWQAQLPDLSSVKIARCYKPDNFESPEYHLHVFSDASERAYAACAYLRVTEGSKVHVTFVMGKTRLSPIKKMTIPRLELSAAVLAVKLAKTIEREIGIPLNSFTFWTDSTAVLRYISNESRRFQTFVANRVARIQECTSRDQWKYVDTRNNPADDGSRGVPATMLSRWVDGPAFLKKGESEWPRCPISPESRKSSLDGELSGEDPEVKKNVFTITAEDKVIDPLIDRYSTWDRLKRAVAWILRVKDHLHSRVKKDDSFSSTGDLTVHELKKAERALIQHVQRQVFPSAFNGSSSSKTSLRKLNPIIKDGMLRVGGRLDRAPIGDEAKHPLILPNHHHVTRLLIEHHHKQVGHSGAGMTWASIRSKYWILKGGAEVRRILGHCLQCKRRNVPRGTQFMADLPKERVTPGTPVFHNSGVDFFGPFFVKQGRSHVKRYGCIFTCMATRAVHLEVANSLETDTFINALRRFINRRGQPAKIWSDNGSNFRGAQRELKENLAQVNSKKVNRYLAQRGIDWKFNPPGASHMGGIWERVIRSVRRILGILLKNQTLTDEGFITMMSEVEAILNSRPLTPLTSDSNDLEPLTPNHLLLYHRNLTVPPGIFTKEDCLLRRRWRQVQYLADQFWRRWVREYLPILQQRQKWTKEEINFKTDDLVLMADDSLPRGKWPLGRICDTYPDKHGRVRQVEVRIGPNQYKRPISKLCLLEAAK
ncbi:uncharacterized protein LOC129265564 [Lytechinus pictus]|uniref:uncharacterized protein LOC129265564 n=1 Tax=Lytechinus pictus TaxID=7653 RepID=UPI0030BA1D34